MRLCSILVLFVGMAFVVQFVPGPLGARQVQTVKPLLLRADTNPSSLLPRDTLFLDDAATIERFLEELDGAPPDWEQVYGSGDDAHMDRLFEVNRERDRRRDGKPALRRRIAFIWEAVVSGYELELGGFRLAIGPKVIPTTWGLVRFKPYGLPSGLVAVPGPSVRRALRSRNAKGETIDVELLLTGHLVPEESFIYDFAHEQPGEGMVMPVVQIERVDYFLVEK